MSYVDVRDPVQNRLLFRYDPERNLVQVRVRGVTHTVDLEQYRAAPTSGTARRRRRGIVSTMDTPLIALASDLIPEPPSGHGEPI